MGMENHSFSGIIVGTGSGERGGTGKGCMSKRWELDTEIFYFYFFCGVFINGVKVQSYGIGHE